MNIVIKSLSGNLYQEKVDFNHENYFEILCENIQKREKIGKESLIRFSFDVQEKLKEIKNNSKASCGVSNHSPVHSRPPLYVQLLLPCVGGKGGFGSMLRAEGKKNLGKKTTNFESSRDLSGRRLRTVNDAKKLAEYIAAAPDRKKMEKEKLEEKIKATQMQIDAALNPSKPKVDNTVFLEEKEKLLESIDGAVEKALEGASADDFGLVKKPGVKKSTKKVSAWKDDTSSDEE